MPNLLPHPQPWTVKKAQNWTFIEWRSALGTPPPGNSVEFRTEVSIRVLPWNVFLDERWGDRRTRGKTRIVLPGPLARLKIHAARRNLLLGLGRHVDGDDAFKVVGEPVGCVDDESGEDILKEANICSDFLDQIVPFPFAPVHEVHVDGS